MNNNPFDQARVSIHAPVKGRLDGLEHNTPQTVVSIHAPVKGRRL